MESSRFLKHCQNMPGIWTAPSWLFYITEYFYQVPCFHFLWFAKSEMSPAKVPSGVWGVLFFLCYDLFVSGEKDYSNERAHGGVTEKCCPWFKLCLPYEPVSIPPMQTSLKLPLYPPSNPLPGVTPWLWQGGDLLRICARLATALQCPGI